MGLKTLARGAALSLMLAMAASAATVSYYTEGSFNGSVFGSSVMQIFGSTSIRFVGASGVVETDSNIGFGAFYVERLNSSNALDLLLGMFSLRVVQVLPAGEMPVPDALTGTFAGSIRMNQSGGSIGFTTNTVEFPSSVYRLGNALMVQPWTVSLIAPRSGVGNAGVTTLQGIVLGGRTGAAVPEPSTYTLLASGIVGLAFLNRGRTNGQPGK